VPGWVEDGQKGIKQYRLKKRLEKAFAFNEEDDIAMEIGVISGEFDLELRARIGTGDVAKTCMEMELPPRERRARPEKILSLQYILMKSHSVASLPCLLCSTSLPLAQPLAPI
jgi:hypothetical protein